MRGARGGVERKGVPCTGNPLILHLGIVDDAVDVEVGFPAASASVKGEGAVSVREVPAARAAVLEHRGPYQELPALYQPLEDWSREHELTPETPIRELYVTNPNDTPDPQQWVTRIAWPVSSAFREAAAGAREPAAARQA